MTNKICENCGQCDSSSNVIGYCREYKGHVSYKQEGCIHWGEKE